MTAEPLELPDLALDQLEVSADNLDIGKAAGIYNTFGCLVVRGLMRQYLEPINRHINQLIDETYRQFDQAEAIPEGWVTPNGCLLIPAPETFERDRQIMCLPLSYRNSSAFFQAALDPTTLDLVEAMLGPDIELFTDGQSLVKEPVGGHPKHLHQDAAYFEHRYDGPVGQLNYAVDTGSQNGCLHVVPGSFKLGVMQHLDTFSHLGLNADEWTWDRALPVPGAAGDSIFFHVNCIHGSQPNQSDRPRPVFINRYRRADDYTVINATSVANRTEAEKNRDQARKDNQRGIMVRGFRAYNGNRDVQADS